MSGRHHVMDESASRGAGNEPKRECAMRDGLEPVLDDVLAARRARTSKRNKGFPNQSAGVASAGRRLTGDELARRAAELGAVVSSPREVSQKKVTQRFLGQPPTPKTSRHRQLPAWLNARMRAQRRLFDIDRPERVA